MKKMNIALVAHDSRKKEMIEWVTFNVKELSKHNLFATGTTGKLIKQIKILSDSFIKDSENGDYTAVNVYEFPFKENVTCLLSGPCGGDAQISAMIAEGKIDVLIFFCDNLIIQGHQNDVSALVRLSSLYNIAFATNRTTADMIISSPLLKDENYIMKKPDFSGYLNRM